MDEAFWQHHRKREVWSGGIGNASVEMKLLQYVDSFGRHYWDKLRGQMQIFTQVCSLSQISSSPRS